MVALVKNVTAKSSRDIVNARMKPEIMPGLSIGSSTFLRAWKGVAPRSRAASYIFGFIWVSFGSTLSTTYGVQKVMWARPTVNNPG